MNSINLSALCAVQIFILLRDAFRR